MATPDTMSFPDYDPVTGQPTFDGWTGNEDPGIITNEAEPGFAMADKLTFAGGALFPPVVFQSERIVNPSPLPDGTLVPAGEYLAFSFFCSLDVSFDSGDLIVIDVRRDPADPTTERRIVIKPNTAIGAAGGTPTVLSGSPAPPPDYGALTGGNPPVQYWKESGGNLVPATFTNVFARAASWHPDVPVATHSGATDQTLPGTIVIDSMTTGFNPAGGVFVTEVVTAAGPESFQIAYTGFTGTAFTGCTGLAAPGLTGTVSAHTPITHSEVGWSVEVLVPVSSSPGSDWLGLGPSFGLYLNLCRLGSTLESGSTFEGPGYSTQYVFHGPLPSPPPSPLPDYLLKGVAWVSTLLPNDWYGTGAIGSNLGLGVRFQEPALPAAPIGVSYSNPPTLPLADLIHGKETPPGPENYLVAMIENTDPANAANGITAEFRFGYWGLPAQSFAEWNQPAGIVATAPPRTAIDLPAAPSGSTPSTGEIVMDWPPAAVTADVTPDPGTTTKHMCMWARLNSPNAINFVQGGLRRNMNFDNLSTVERSAEISGKGYPAPSGGHHEFLLIPHARQIRVPQVEPDVGSRAAGTKTIWYWIVEGLRKTGETITIDKVTADIYDPSPGEFGLLLEHDVAGDLFAHELSGGGIRRGPGNTYLLKVPHDGTVTIQTSLEGAPPKPPVVTKPDPWWLRFLKWLIALIKKLF